MSKQSLKKKPAKKKIKKEDLSEIRHAMLNKIDPVLEIPALGIAMPKSVWDNPIVKRAQEQLLRDAETGLAKIQSNFIHRCPSRLPHYLLGILIGFGMCLLSWPWVEKIWTMVKM